MNIKAIFRDKIFQAGAGNVIGNFLIKGSSVLFSFYFATVMTQEEYGEVSTFLSYASFLSVLIGLNLYSSVNNAKLDFAKDFHRYNSSILTLSTLCFAVLCGIAIVFRDPLANLLHLSQTNLALLFIYSFSLYILMFFQAVNISQYKYKSNLTVSFINVFAGFALSLILMKAVLPHDKITGKNLGITIPLAAIALFVLFSVFLRGKRGICLSYWKYALIIAGPNIAHTLAQDVLSQSDRIFIRNMCSAADVGIYSLIYYFGLCVNLLWSGINGVWVPWLFERLKQGDLDVIRSRSKRYVQLFSLLTAALCAVVPPFVKWFLPEEYLVGLGLVCPIILSGYFMCIYSFMANLEFYHKKNSFIAVGTIAAALVNIVLNYIFIGMFGYQAAAYTTLASYVFLFFFHYVIADKILKINIYKMKTFAIYSLLTCAVSAAISWLWNSLLL